MVPPAENASKSVEMQSWRMRCMTVRGREACKRRSRVLQLQRSVNPTADCRSSAPAAMHSHATHAHIGAPVSSRPSNSQRSSMRLHATAAPASYEVIKLREEEVDRDKLGRRICV